MAKARKFSLGCGHDTVGDHFARRVLHVDGGVRGEIFRKSVQERNILSGGRRGIATDNGKKDHRRNDNIKDVDHHENFTKKKRKNCIF